MSTKVRISRGVGRGGANLESGAGLGVDAQLRLEVLGSEYRPGLQYALLEVLALQ